MMSPQALRATDWVRRGLLTVAVGLILCGPLAAQCAMCREAASYQRQEAINALKRGIIVLAIPPAGIIVGIACLTYRYRGTPDDAGDRRRSDGLE
jgi:hypothetical protein